MREEAFSRGDERWLGLPRVSSEKCTTVKRRGETEIPFFSYRNLIFKPLKHTAMQITFIIYVVSLKI